MTEPDELIEHLLVYYDQLSRGERPDLQFDLQSDTPWEVLRQLAQESDPERAWSITQDLLLRAPESALGYIAAGPLEDLISFHGRQFIGEFEGYAVRNERLSAALRFVVVDRWVPDEVRSRLRRLCQDLRVDDSND